MKIEPHRYYTTDINKITNGSFLKVKENAFRSILIKYNGQIVKVTSKPRFDDETRKNGTVFFWTDENYTVEVDLDKFELDED